jgi:hypothetical protein
LGKRCVECGKASVQIRVGSHIGLRLDALALIVPAIGLSVQGQIASDLMPHQPSTFLHSALSATTSFRASEDLPCRPDRTAFSMNSPS